MEFSKPAFNAQQHLELLIGRGLKVSDKVKASHFISNLGYYRLSGYMYPLQVPDGTHQFKESVTFDLVIDHYNFDRKLRLLILDFIERIEVGLRAILSDTYARRYGPHWYLDTTLFKNPNTHARFVEKVKLFCDSCEFQFIKKYMFKYDNPPEPPCWMIMETLTFGQLSVLFENLKGGVLKSEVAAKFNAASPILESWLRSINSLRNFCAHHARIWNRKFAIKPIIPLKESWKFLENIEDDTNQRLYGILSCMVKMMENVNPNADFKIKLKDLFREYNCINIHYIGFQKEWTEEQIWQ